MSIIDEIIEAHGHTAPPTGAFTIYDYVEEVKERGGTIGTDAARRALSEDPRLQSRLFSVKGSVPTMYYWEKEETNEG